MPPGLVVDAALVDLAGFELAEVERIHGIVRSGSQAADHEDGGDDQGDRGENVNNDFKHIAPSR